MKVAVQVIDTHGFLHLKTGKSKAQVLQWLAQLKEGTEIRWLNNRSVFVSQQYVK